MLITEIAVAAPCAAAIGAGLLWRRERAAHRRTEADAAAGTALLHTREAALRDLADGWMPALVRGWAEPFDPALGEPAGSAFAAALEAIVANTLALERQRAQEQRTAEHWYGQASAAAHQLQEFATEQRQQAAAAQLPAWTEALLLLARRAHPLVDEAVKGLSAAERGVEDPELLHVLFGVDQRAVLLRRLIENAALLAGQVPRGLARSTPVATALRTGAAEILAFGQIEHVPPREELYLPGHVAWALIRIVAELADNATRFSPPTSPVVVDAVVVAEGLVVTVRDRGLPLTGAQLDWLNGVLAGPEGPSAVEQLRSGQLGLLVCARLARGLGLSVSLEAGSPGVTAKVFIPGQYLSADAPAEAGRQPAAAAHGPAGAQAQPALVSAVRTVPGPAGSGAPPLPQRVRRSTVPAQPAARDRPLRATEPPAASTALAASWLTATRRADSHHIQPSES
ncbi:ATP-binding protein [Kitasatospora sp. NPDC088783]|uniref:ATP-binding protein n=1 Tax=Kitasatospora sp. NPDC088783 TaxID=3364077 RepID=UPI0037F1E7EA